MPYDRDSHLPDNQTLPQAVTTLYSFGVVKGDLGDFGHLILLHATYEEAFRSRGYFTRQTSPHSSSASHAIGGENTEGANNSQQRTPLKCVQVCNRAITAHISRAGGEKSLLILHLAMAHVVLLVPYNSIRTLVKSIIKSTSPHATWHTSPRRDAASAEQEVLDWAQKDEV
jgi:hypothetical protein